jgi:hypothetical protein
MQQHMKDQPCPAGWIIQKIVPIQPGCQFANLLCASDASLNATSLLSRQVPRIAGQLGSRILKQPESFMTSIGHEHAIIHPSGVQKPMNGASPTLWPSRCAVDPAKAPAQGVRARGALAGRAAENIAPPIMLQRESYPQETATFGTFR